jgi:hypothetical protein
LMSEGYVIGSINGSYLATDTVTVETPITAFVYDGKTTYGCCFRCNAPWDINDDTACISCGSKMDKRVFRGSETETLLESYFVGFVHDISYSIVYFLLLFLIKIISCK